MQRPGSELILIQKRLTLVLNINTHLITRAVQLQAMLAQAKTHTTPPPASVLQSISNLQTNIYKCLHGNLSYVAKITELFPQIQKRNDGSYLRNIGILESLKPAVMECPDQSMRDLQQMYLAMNMLFSDQAVANAHRDPNAPSTFLPQQLQQQAQQQSQNGNINGNHLQFGTRNM